MRGTISSDQIAAASKQGNGTLLQMYVGTTPVSGHVPVFDANGNIIDSGAAPGTGSGGGVGTGFTVSVDGVATGLTGLGSGGGSSSSTYPFVNLTAPTSSGWTWTNQGSSTVAISNGVMSMAATGTGSDQLRYYARSLPITTPWTVIAAFIPGHGQWDGGQGNYSEGIALSDGTKYRTFWVSYPGGSSSTSDSTYLYVQGYDNVTSFNSSYNLSLHNLPALPIAWLKIHDDGSIRSYSLSVDPTNVGWSLLATEAHTALLSAVWAGIVTNLYGSSLSGVSVQGVPWLSWQILNS